MESGIELSGSIIYGVSLYNVILIRYNGIHLNETKFIYEITVSEVKINCIVVVK